MGSDREEGVRVEQGGEEALRRCEPESQRPGHVAAPGHGARFRILPCERFLRGEMGGGAGLGGGG